MRYLDVCAGISASSVAWKPLGWEAAAYSEIEAAPRAILEHRQGALPVGWDHRHAPGSNITPLFGDFTQIEAHHVGPIDLLVGGTPCQDFSVAGLRAGLDGDRGNLSLEFLRLADRTRPRWLVWENVPGVLSIDGGRAFGAILGGLGELGYGFAYRVLDAQHFGVPQRRRRVFVVGYLGDWRAPAAVLLERKSVSGVAAPRRSAGEGFTHDLAPSLTSSGRGVERIGETRGQDPVVAFDPKSCLAPHGSAAVSANAFPLKASGGKDQQMVAIPLLEIGKRTGSGGEGPNGGGFGRAGDPMFTLQSGAQHGVGTASAVRRLTPRECERLQGFPDDYTLVPNRGKPMADGPRYKALGNSMAVPVMRWIGERIAAVDAIPDAERAAA